ncbi:hypothetical protein CISG_07594 [Coccidioides immitis RMSCC 3703]|uniref:Uncharacterized protein n=1 Tax=Coccidioides immitis RMSCC 3703 TaxID=454286 RepID=A0A0J8R2H3_COCIT|nr:hypothetical protein CISG_07594 [Coccidioides immitis RMSCC 3703]
MQPLTSLLKWTARSQTVCGDHEQSDRREYTGDGKSKHYRQHRGGMSGVSLSTFGFNSSRTNNADFGTHGLKQPLAFRLASCDSRKRFSLFVDVLCPVNATVLTSASHPYHSRSLGSCQKFDIHCWSPESTLEGSWGPATGKISKTEQGAWKGRRQLPRYDHHHFLKLGPRIDSIIPTGSTQSTFAPLESHESMIRIHKVISQEVPRLAYLPALVRGLNVHMLWSEPKSVLDLLPVNGVSTGIRWKVLLYLLATFDVPIYSFLAPGAVVGVKDIWIDPILIPTQYCHLSGRCGPNRVKPYRPLTLPAPSTSLHLDSGEVAAMFSSDGSPLTAKVMAQALLLLKAFSLCDRAICSEVNMADPIAKAP